MRLVVVVLAIAIATRAHAMPVPTLEHPFAVEDVPIEYERGVIEKALFALRAEGVHMAVVVTRRLDGSKINSYARRVAERWWSGDEYAAVLVIAVEARQSRLEVNDALRVKLDDNRASSILYGARLHLRDHLYARAVLAIIAEVGRAARGPALPPPPPTPPTPPSRSPSPPEPEPAGSFPIGWLLGTVVVLAVVVWIGRMFAISARKERVTIMSNKWVETRPFWKDWVIGSLKVLGLPIFGIFLLLISLPSGSSHGSAWTSGDSGSWNTSDYTPDVDYGSGGSSGGDSGWSGGGASTSW